MSSEIFPLTEEELDEMILQVQRDMETAQSQLQYDQLHDKLKELRETRRQLLITNNTI